MKWRLLYFSVQPQWETIMSRRVRILKNVLITLVSIYILAEVTLQLLLL